MKGLPNRLRRVFAATALAAAALPGVLALGLAAPATAQAQDKEVTIAYQQIVDPWLVAMASGEFEKATGYKIHWRQFESGAKVATALASGDIKIGVLGSSPMAAAVSQGLDLQLFWILDDINQAEAMVVRNASNIKTPADLKGKKIGVPFVSTTHYHTMFALQQWGIKPTEVQVLNMQPNQIVAAWERGDIDAAYVWDPALAQIKQTGHVLITSGELSKQGKPTFDGIAVDRKWGEANADFMAKFVKVIADADAAYRQHQAAWTATSPQVKAIVKTIGGKPEDVPGALSLYAYPSAQQQASAEWLGGGKDSRAAKALKDTADFLKSQQKINEVKADYTPYVTSRYVDAALKLK
ncbi:taurine ABC transporter substrate-binding protein [Pandoraea pneumonica]|jgi:taurine transport system substrate-binding protein|uniref:Taurine ABC transporter substrate-binding protein n=1 Tax=Pandoraea pneumonica TaxID=2508299 RepID=A0A5E4VZB6_9BURK|nr:taurine ABC transporter substrate-binding protein [Pandoraea pneumonica]VVE16370.1 taurine ABC transporter substrate-binding protein [Pandoraea pneumonica]